MACNRDEQCFKKGDTAIKKIDSILDGIDLDQNMDVISLNSSFSGDFRFGEYVRIEGNLEGNIISDGILITGENSHVKAEINGNVVVINGNFEGNVTAEKLLILDSCSIVNASVKTPNMYIKDGATFNGSISMMKYYPNKFKQLESF